MREAISRLTVDAGGDLELVTAAIARAAAGSHGQVRSVSYLLAALTSEKAARADQAQEGRAKGRPRLKDPPLEDDPRQLTVDAAATAEAAQATLTALAQKLGGVGGGGQAVLA
jgi:hypothetical protein